MVPVTSLLIPILVAAVIVFVASAIVHMVLPYHRGLRGILTNLVVGIGGALLGGFVGRAVGLYGSVANEASFLFAAGGALATLALFHTAWHAQRRRHTRA